MEDLTQFQELIVRQEVEHLEVFTGFETENRYSVMTPEGEQILYAFEESGFFGRQFLNSHRALNLYVIDQDSQPVLTAHRDFFWFLSHLYMSDADDRLVGSLHREFAMLHRRFTLRDPNGISLVEVQGSLFRPNTFIIRRQGVEVSRITKQWGGILREAFTDADTFRVQFDQRNLSQDLYLLILATAFAIDLDFFESGAGGPSFGG